MYFSTKTKTRILKKYLHIFEKEHRKYITDYKECYRTAANILILRRLLERKAQKYSKWRVKPVLIQSFQGDNK